MISLYSSWSWIHIWMHITNSYMISWSWIYMRHFMTYEFIYEFMYMKMSWNHTSNHVYQGSKWNNCLVQLGPCQWLRQAILLSCLGASLILCNDGQQHLKMAEFGEKPSLSGQFLHFLRTKYRKSWCEVFVDFFFPVGGPVVSLCCKAAGLWSIRIWRSTTCPAHDIYCSWF